MSWITDVSWMRGAFTVSRWRIPSVTALNPSTTPPTTRRCRVLKPSAPNPEHLLPSCTSRESSAHNPQRLQNRSPVSAAQHAHPAPRDSNTAHPHPTPQTRIDAHRQPGTPRRAECDALISLPRLLGPLHPPTPSPLSHTYLIHRHESRRAQARPPPSAHRRRNQSRRLAPTPHAHRWRRIRNGSLRTGLGFRF